MTAKTTRRASAVLFISLFVLLLSRSEKKTSPVFDSLKAASLVFRWFKLYPSEDKLDTKLLPTNKIIYIIKMSLSNALKGF